MIKDFNEILIVSEPDLGKVALDHQRRWVFRILSKMGINLSAAAALYPSEGEIKLRPWSDFLITHGIDILYDLAAGETTVYFSTERQVIGRWRDPRRVRSKAHGPGKAVLLFSYAEPE